jgi:hypothetical protein
MRCFAILESISKQTNDRSKTGRTGGRGHDRAPGVPADEFPGLEKSGTIARVLATDGGGKVMTRRRDDDVEPDRKGRRRKPEDWDDDDQDTLEEWNEERRRKGRKRRRDWRDHPRQRDAEP